MATGKKINNASRKTGYSFKAAFSPGRWVYADDVLIFNPSHCLGGDLPIKLTPLSAPDERATKSRADKHW